VKPTNPKDLIGSDKLPLHLWPETATILGSLGLLDGALKYGRSNYRAVGIRASIYFDATRRHLNAWFEGEEPDPDSGLPHLAHALACLAILVDAEATGKLNDDRMIKGGYRKLLEEMTPHVKRLKAKHADKAPKHYTIADDATKDYGDEARNNFLPVGTEVPAVQSVPHEAAQSLHSRAARPLVFGHEGRSMGRVEVGQATEAPCDAGEAWAKS
jgi:Domain of unknown function (DUF5664)